MGQLNFMIQEFPCPVCRTGIYSPHCSNCGWEDPNMLRARADFMESMMKPKNAAVFRRLLKVKNLKQFAKRENRRVR